MLYIPQGKKKEGSNAAFAVNVAQKRKYRFAIYCLLYPDLLISVICSSLLYFVF